MTFLFYLSKISLHLIGAWFIVPEAYVVLDFELISIKDLSDFSCSKPLLSFKPAPRKMQYTFYFGRRNLMLFSPNYKRFFPSFYYSPPSPFFLLYEQKKHQPHPVFCLLYWTSLITVFGWFLIIAPSIYFLCKLPQNSLNQGVFKYFYWATLLCINSIFPIYFICYTYCKIYIIIKHAFLIYFILLYLLISYLQ